MEMCLLAVAAAVALVLLWGRYRRAVRRERILLEERFAEEFSSRFAAMLAEDRFIPHSLWRPLVDDTRDLFEMIQHAPCRYVEGTERALKDYSAAEDAVVEHNNRYCKAELERNAKFFDTLAAYPLDAQQRLACVRDECSSLVVAGAGSGKTSVIMAKVAYLVEIKHVDPEKILLLTFAKKAADEMSDRVARRLGDGKVIARTFHSFGSRLILRLGAGRRNIAADDCLRGIVHEAFTGHRIFTTEAYDNILSYCNYFLDPEDEAGQIIDDKAIRDSTCQIGVKVTYRGESVKSLEEAMIANFLYLNGVDYRYESPYTKPYARDSEHVDYRPDFYLPEYDLYIEHFGVDKDGEPPDRYRPDEREAYKQGMKWKRKVHRKNGTILVESYSWWNRERRLLENLRAALEARGVRFSPIDPRSALEMIRKLSADKISGVEEMLVTFISLFKSNGYGVEMFNKLSDNENGSWYVRERTRLFLRIARDVYQAYEQDLSEKGQYDFNDMILKATKLLASSPKGTLGYEYVIVDEFQDMSLSRALLLKEILAQSRAKLFCVGDDWQSIYRFAGSDINLFVNFGDYFGYHDRLHIDTTYRNSQELIDLMGLFITNNSQQIPKQLKSSKHCQSPVVSIRYDNTSYSKVAAKARALDVALGRISEECGDKGTSILILGRHTSEGTIANSCDSLISKGGDLFRLASRPNVVARFMTVHKAKGCEADYVVLLNADNDTYGFPNQITDDPLIQLVISKPDFYPFAEERRLFYVAMTRTRNRTYVLVPKKDESPFVAELRNIMKQSLSNQGSPHLICPLCGSRLVQRRNRRTGSEFIGCSSFPSCRYVQPQEKSGRVATNLRRC